MATNTRESGQNRPGPGYVTHLEIGLVVDNVDPEKLGRVKVSFPQQPGDIQSQWIRLASPMAGSGRGFYAIPEKDDEVLVGYLHGDIRHPVVLGAKWNGQDKAPTEADSGMPTPDKTDTGGSWSTETFTQGSTDTKNNDRRFWKSRSGHLLAFDDTSGKETVQIWDKDHNLSIVLDSAKKLITIANTQGDLHVRTKGNLFLEAGQDINIKAGQNLTEETGQTTSLKAGTELKTESTTGSTLKSGADFNIQSNANLSAKANANISLEANVNLEAKGNLQASFQGGVMAELKAAIVKIN